MDTTIYTALAREPVPGDSPAGIDARYEDDFSALQAEIDKMTALASQEPINWNLVAELASRILKEQSKDFLVAAYLGAALVQLHSVAGLEAGIGLWQGLCANFWEQAFPALKRIRARMNAFAWWQEKTTDWLRRYEGPALEAERHAALVEAVKNLDQTLAELMPDMSPWADTINLIKNLPVQAPPPPAAAPAEAAADEQQPQAAEPGGQTGLSLNFQDMSEAKSVLAEATSAYASFALAQSPEDPLARLASRLAVWAKLERVPPAEGGLTMLEAPDAAIKTTIQRLLSDGKFQEAVIQAETQIPAYLFWLDLHRLAYEGLEQQGEQYAPAALAVKQAVLLFTARFPGVRDLCFNDGTPFADADTAGWLEQSEGAAAGAGSGRQGPALPLEDARRLAETGDTAGALALLAQAGKNANDGPSRFILLTAQTRLLAQAGQAGLASPLADALIAEIDRRGLEDWNPELAAQGLSAARMAYAGLGEDGGKDARAAGARLVRLDPSFLQGL